MNLANLIVAVIVITLIAADIRYLRRHKPSCHGGGGCAGCSGCSGNCSRCQMKQH